MIAKCIWGNMGGYVVIVGWGGRWRMCGHLLASYNPHMADSGKQSPLDDTICQALGKQAE